MEIEDARAAALVQLALPGTAYVYQGEELGLEEIEDLPDEEVDVEEEEIDVEVGGDEEEVEETEDRLVVHGSDGTVPGGGAIVADLDHRIAMAFLVLGLGAEAPVEIDNGAPIETSFPDFPGLMRGLGAKISQSTPS